MQFRILAASSSFLRRLWYRHQLECHGCRVETVSDGLACIEKAIEFRPHAIILESALTRGGSDSVLAAKESDPRLKSIHVIVVDVGRDAAQTYRLGGHDLAGYWKWPPDPIELINGVRAAFGRDTLPTSEIEVLAGCNRG